MGSSYTRTLIHRRCRIPRTLLHCRKRPQQPPERTLRSQPTPTAKVPRGTYRVTESESESEPSDKEPVQQLEDSSDPISESVLSPLTGLSLIAEGKSKEPDTGPPELPKKEVDPFDAEFEDAPEPEEEESNC